MWYGHHPFFLFLLPGLTWEKLERWSNKKVEEKFQDALEDERATRVEIQQLEDEIKEGEAMQRADIRFVAITTAISAVCIAFLEVSSARPLSFVAVFGVIWVIGAFFSTIISIKGWAAILHTNTQLNKQRDRLRLRKQQLEQTNSRRS